MKKLNLYIAVNAAILYTLVLLLNTSSFARADAKKETAVNTAPAVNTQTVNAQKAGASAVGIDQTRNPVQLVNSEANTLAVKVVGSSSVKKPFQTRIVLDIPSGGIARGPEGKL